LYAELGRIGVLDVVAGLTSEKYSVVVVDVLITVM
jgi:hypothetical protein